MSLLQAVRNTVSNLVAPQPSEADAMTGIKALYEDKIHALPSGDHAEFLRSLNRSQNIADLWALRTEFYSLTSRAFGELQAIRDTEVLQAWFQPFIDRKLIQGAGSRTSAAPSTLSSRLSGPASRQSSRRDTQPTSTSDMAAPTQRSQRPFIESTAHGLRTVDGPSRTEHRQGWTTTVYM